MTNIHKERMDIACLPEVKITRETIKAAGKICKHYRVTNDNIRVTLLRIVRQKVEKISVIRTKCGIAFDRYEWTFKFKGIKEKFTAETGTDLKITYEHYLEAGKFYILHKDAKPMLDEAYPHLPVLEWCGNNLVHIN